MGEEGTGGGVGGAVNVKGGWVPNLENLESAYYFPIHSSIFPN